MFKFRAQRINSTEWVHGFYAEKQLMGKHYILQEEVEPYCTQTVLTEIEVNPATLGQLRHVNQHGEYYDGDVYYHAGYGMETVSDICELQFALASGNAEDICHIAGNIYDIPFIFHSQSSVSSLSPKN